MDRDLLRSAALRCACAGFVAVPVLGPLVGGGEQSRRFDTVITPPDYAFAIWAPIFACCIASTVEQSRPGARSGPLSRRTGWPLAGAYAANALWSVAAQTRFALTPVLLPIATACAATAHARLQDHAQPAGQARATVVSTGLLLGWTALASTVNLAAGALLLGVDTTSRRTLLGSTAGLAAASGLLTAAAAVSRRGSVPLATAAAWGLLTTALTPGRPPAVRLVSAGGGITVMAAGTWRTARDRRLAGRAR